MPRLLRYMLFPEGAEFIGRYNFPYFSGPPLVDITVPVAERIPEETLDALRAMGDGMFRLKLRIHPKTLLVGWDIERRPGLDPKKRDSLGQIAYVAPVFSHIGGDFREARIRNGIVLVKGWYIDPETKQRVETDF